MAKLQSWQANRREQVFLNGIEKLTPCHPSEIGAVPMTWRDVPASKLLEPSLTTEEIYAVVNKTKPTVSDEDTKKCEEWTELYGEDGS